jgi:hypothetical protein
MSTPTKSLGRSARYDDVGLALDHNAAAMRQLINPVLVGAPALITSDAQHGQLAGDIAECDRAVAGHHNHPSNRNARSICAVAASASLRFPVSAAISNSSAAKSQCGRA